MKFNSLGNTLYNYYQNPYVIDETLGYNDGSSITFQAFDALGSVRAEVDIFGNSIAEIEYDAYGNHLYAAPHEYGYAGRILDTETDLYYNRARMYDPEVGRFTTKDPLGMIDGPNMYAYFGNNPTIFNDPLGLGTLIFGKDSDGEWIKEDHGNGWVESLFEKPEGGVWCDCSTGIEEGGGSCACYKVYRSILIPPPGGPGAPGNLYAYVENNPNKWTDPSGYGVYPSEFPGGSGKGNNHPPPDWCTCSTCKKIGGNCDPGFELKIHYSGYQSNNPWPYPLPAGTGPYSGPLGPDDMASGIIHLPWDPFPFPPDWPYPWPPWPFPGPGPDLPYLTNKAQNNGGDKSICNGADEDDGDWID
ncbi:MAG: RHS repeat-associated core domain-containing protein [Bacteroidales bacterium]|nr:RHS repeat-associated core domain-containing protein [Bacteroidales bacterium]